MGDAHKGEKVIKMERSSMTSVDEEKLDDLVRQVQDMKKKVNRIYYIVIALLAIFILIFIVSALAPA